MFYMFSHNQQLLQLVKNLISIQTGNTSFQEDTCSIVQSLPKEVVILDIVLQGVSLLQISVFLKIHISNSTQLLLNCKISLFNIEMYYSSWCFCYCLWTRLNFKVVCAIIDSWSYNKYLIVPFLSNPTQTSNNNTNIFVSLGMLRAQLKLISFMAMNIQQFCKHVVRLLIIFVIKLASDVS